MKIQRAFKTELSPNNKQRSLFNRCVGSSRFVYNWGLAEWKRQYEAGEKPSEYSLRRAFNAQKDEVCPWIREVPYAVTESAFANLGLAFKSFFRRVKNGDAKAGYPRFKKRGVNNSFQLQNTRVETDKVRLTGAGWVRLKERGYIPTDGDYGNYATVSSQGGRWFISVQVEMDIPDPEPTNNPPMGIDVGLKSLAVCSDGMVFENPRTLGRAERKLKRLQRELSRREKGSKNRAKTKEKIAKAHKRVADIRCHTLHDVSHYVTVTAKPSVVVMEDLNIKGMMANHRMAKAIGDASPYELRRQIEYKAGWNGIEFILADRFYPSTKTCHACGSVQPMKLSDRVYRCGNCGTEIDRDLNAAMNLAALSEPPNGRGLPVELECSNALL